MRNKRMLTLMLSTFLVTMSWGLAAPGTPSPEELAKQVRKALVMQPYYGVFDDLGFQIEGSTVTLVGHVVRPTLKSSAERVVQRLPGVQAVVNQIKVLPASPYDDRLRLHLYWAIYGNEVFLRHAMRALPPIHIIVDNGRVTLSGYVASGLERNVAQVQANQIPGVFSVVNNLKVDS